jgi:acetaldehyde dehydrogenase/alcohol dehydrogenase
LPGGAFRTFDFRVAVLGGTNEEEKVELLIGAIEDLKRQLNIPVSLKEAIATSEAEFLAKLNEVADRAFDDQCTGTNPRYPLISDLNQLLTNTYYVERWIV